jgi:hypothetical protein
MIGACGTSCFALCRIFAMRRFVFGLRQLRDVGAGILERDSLGPRGGPSNVRFQPRPIVTLRPDL